MASMGWSAAGFSADATLVAIAQSRAVFVWNTSTRDLDRIVPYPQIELRPHRVEMADGGKTVKVYGTLGRQQKVALTATGTEAAKEFPYPTAIIGRSPQPGAPGLKTAVSEDGRREARLSNGTVEVVDRASGKTLATLGASDGSMEMIALSHDGKLLAGWTLARFRLLSGRMGKEAAPAPKHTPFVELWDVASGKRVWRTEGHGGMSLVFAPGGRWLTGPRTRLTRKLIRVRDGAVRDLGRDAWLRAIAPNGTMAAVADANGLRLERLDRKPPATRIKRRRLVAMSRDGKTRVARGGDGNLEVHRGGACTRTPLQANHYRRLAFSTDGLQLYAANNGYTRQAVARWDVAAGRVADAIAIRPQGTVVVLPDIDRMLVQGPDWRVRFLDLSTFEERRSVLPPMSGYGMGDGTGQVFKVRTGWYRHLDRNYDKLSNSSGAVSGDGRVIATPVHMGKKLWIALWDAENGGSLRDQPVDFRVVRLALSSDARLLAAGGHTGQLGLWDNTSGKRLPLSFRHTQAVTQLTLSEDGTLLASAGKDGKILLHRTDDGARVGTVDLRQRYDQAEHLWFLNGDRRLVVGTQRGALFEFEVAPKRR